MNIAVLFKLVHFTLELGTSMRTKDLYFFLVSN
jgi:hypothetical protein